MFVGLVAERQYIWPYMDREQMVIILEELCHFRAFMIKQIQLNNKYRLFQCGFIGDVFVSGCQRKQYKQDGMHDRLCQ